MALACKTRNALLISRLFRSQAPALVRCMSDEMGSGSGKGGGTGGTIREAGGAFGKRQAAQEEQYFRKLQEAQIKQMKEHLGDEVKHHEKEIKRHKEAIERHRRKMSELAKHDD